MTDPVSPAPAAPSTTPAALRLPDDVWLLILNCPQLTYADLKCFSRVCKRFHQLEQNPQLDARLFRRGYPAGRPRFGRRTHPLKAGDRVAFHPVLHLTCLSRPDLQEADITVFPDDGEPREYKPLDLPVANEFATSPPCVQLIFCAGTSPVIADAGGVRVRSVIEVVTSMWASPAPAEYKFQMMMELGVGMGDGDPLQEELEARLEAMTMWDTLGDNTFWAGMRRARCVADGVVELTPKDFD